MTRGDKKCIDANCTYCPFSTPSNLKLCTGFKRSETLNQGLENGKYLISEKKYNEYKEFLKEEV